MNELRWEDILYKHTLTHMHTHFSELQCKCICVCACLISFKSSAKDDRLDLMLTELKMRFRRYVVIARSVRCVCVCACWCVFSMAKRECFARAKRCDAMIVTWYRFVPAIRPRFGTHTAREWHHLSFGFGFLGGPGNCGVLPLCVHLNDDAVGNKRIASARSSNPLPVRLLMTYTVNDYDNDDDEDVDKIRSRVDKRRRRANVLYAVQRQRRRYASVSDEIDMHACAKVHVNGTNAMRCDAELHAAGFRNNLSAVSVYFVTACIVRFYCVRSVY